MFPWKTLPLTESEPEPEEAEEGLFAITIAITEGILEMSALMMPYTMNTKTYFNGHFPDEPGLAGIY